MNVAPVQTFAATICGARLGFRWLKSVRAFVRVSGESDQWLIEIVREGKDMPRQPSKEPYRAWWEAEGAAEELTTVLTRQAGGVVFSPKPPCKLLVDDEGRLVELEAPA